MSVLQDDMHKDYHCPPAVTDASTHFGAMTDIESGESARVPVGLGAYLPSKPSKVRLVIVQGSGASAKFICALSIGTGGMTCFAMYL